MSDTYISVLAGRQDGVFARWQTGMTRGEINHRLRTAQWHIVYRAVYSLTPSVSLKGRRRAAVLTFGPKAHAGFRLAANLWGLQAPPGLHVIHPTGHSRDRIRVHRERLPDAERAAVDGIPVTSVARTLADLAATERFRVVEKAIERADQLRILDFAAIEALDPRKAGPLLEIMGTTRPGTTITESVWEERFLAASRAAGLPDPELNAPFVLPDGTAIKVDALFRPARVAVEIDDRTHMTPEAFARDRHRDRQLTIAGLRPFRIPATDIAGGVRDLVTLLGPSR